MALLERPIKIGIDGYNLALEKGTGVAAYGRALASTIREMGGDISALFGVDMPSSQGQLTGEIAIYDSMARRSRWPKAMRPLRQIYRFYAHRTAHEIERAGHVIDDGRLRNINRLLNIPGLYPRSIGAFRRYDRFSNIRVPGIDLMHWTYPLPIAARSTPNIYTLHDLVPLRLPHVTLDDKEAYLRLVRVLVTRADHIVTVSETSRRDIISLLGADPERVTNSYQFSDIIEDLAGLDVAEQTTLLTRGYQLEPKGYYLFFGAIEPKKNLARTLEAYLASGVISPLVVVGTCGWSAERETELIAASAAGRERPPIRFFNHVSRQSLAALIRGARATVFPSIYEGFGLPVLESMECGTAVITSNQGSLPEVAGDAALLVDPYDPRAIMTAIRAIEEDDNLRLKLEARAAQRAVLFSKERYMARLSDIYSRTLDRAGRMS